jgi:hypothetical protein
MATDFAVFLRWFLTGHLAGLRGYSTHTIASYRDAFKLLICYFRDELSIPPDKLTLDLIDAAAITGFLSWLRTSRGNSASTSNQRQSLRIDEAAALPSPPVLLSGRLNQYYGRLRRPPGSPPTSRLRPVIGRDAPATIFRRLPGRGGPPQFPPPLSAHSAPHTPGSPSRLRFQALHRFHGLRPGFERLGTPLSHPKTG